MRTSCVGLVPGVKTSELRSGDGDSGCVGGWLSPHRRERSGSTHSHQPGLSLSGMIHLMMHHAEWRQFQFNCDEAHVTMRSSVREVGCGNCGGVVARLVQRRLARTGLI